MLSVGGQSRASKFKLVDSIHHGTVDQSSSCNSDPEASDGQAELEPQNEPKAHSPARSNGINLKTAKITINIFPHDQQDLINQALNKPDDAIVVNQTTKGRFHVIEKILPKQTTQSLSDATKAETTEKAENQAFKIEVISSSSDPTNQSSHND